MPKLPWRGAAIAAVVILALRPDLAFGQNAGGSGALAASVSDPGSIVVPLGIWITSLLAWARDALVGLAALAAARWAPAALRQYLTDQLLTKAVDYGLAVVRGAVRGQALTIPIANKVVEQAAGYALANAPALAKWLGDTLRPKILARLSAAGAIPADADRIALGVPLASATQRWT